MEINVLSYNVSWQAMNGIDKKVQGAQCKTKVENQNQCRDNVFNFIDNLKPSLFGIQETGLFMYDLSWLKEYKVYSTYKNLKLDVNKDGYEASFGYNISIFSNITKSFFPGNDYLEGTFPTEAGYGRVYQILVLQIISNDETILFINSHFNHGANIQSNLDHLSSLLIGKSFDHIIMTGDFNTNLNTVGSLKLIDKQLIVHNNEKTCCDNYLNKFPMIVLSDNILSNGLILDNIRLPISADNNRLFSDHLPLLATFKLPTIIGYDFDGVLHKSVGIPELTGKKLGQRHPDVSLSYDKLVPYDKIITQIKKQIDEGKKIRIISANINKDIKQNFINKHFIENKYRYNIKILDVNPSGKNEDIKKVSEFYDDSVNVLVEFISKNYKLPVKLFLVIPELDTWYPVKNVPDVKNTFMILLTVLLAIESKKVRTGKLDKKIYNDLKDTIIERFKIL
jgi:endonuclease/exonuclease/phosphatase family metal-dependent hydrolase